MSCLLTTTRSMGGIFKLSRPTGHPCSTPFTRGMLCYSCRTSSMGWRLSPGGGDKCWYTHTYAYTHICTYIHTHRYTQTHAYTQTHRQTQITLRCCHTAVTLLLHTCYRWWSSGVGRSAPVLTAAGASVAHTHTNTHTQTHTHTHTHTGACPLEHQTVRQTGAC
jgi:hypothetical protein